MKFTKTTLLQFWKFRGVRASTVNTLIFHHNFELFSLFYLCFCYILWFSYDTRDCVPREEGYCLSLQFNFENEFCFYDFKLKVYFSEMEMCLILIWCQTNNYELTDIKLDKMSTPISYFSRLGTLCLLYFVQVHINYAFFLELIK